MNYTVGVDWLSITGKLKKGEGDVGRNDFEWAASFARKICNAAIGREELLSPVPASRHYANSFIGLVSGIRVNIGGDIYKQGWQVVLSGGVCSKITDWRAVAEFVAIWQARITRCDLKIDLIDGGVSPNQFRKEYEAQYGDDTPRQFSFVKSRNGDTVYLGSRSSERMMRVYDKAAEQGVRADWLRVEMEFKEGEAHRAFETYLNNPLAVAAEFADFIKGDCNGVYLHLRRIARNAVSERQITPKTVGDTEKWLSGQVLASFEKLGLNDEAAMDRVFQRLHETYIAVKLWNILNPVDK